MSSTEEVKAAIVRPPYDYGSTPNDFGVLKFTAGDIADTRDHQVDVIPDEWLGKWVELYVAGGVAGTDAMHYAFSLSPTAEVDRAVVATEAGVAAKVGAVIPTGVSLHVRLPLAASFTASSVAVYFVRESTAIGMECYMRLAS